MGARFSSCFSNAKAEESPSTIVPKLEAMTMVGAEGPFTSGRMEYYSARCEAMARSRGQFSDDVALEIEFSKPRRSEVIRHEVVPQSAEEEELNQENRKVLKQLRRDHPFLFGVDLSGYVLGRMITEGGQAKIYEVVGWTDILMKVFERGTSLRDLQQLFPLPVLDKDIRQCTLSANLLPDGRFAFLMDRCWGDLRNLIDQAMMEKKLDGTEGPPFPYNGWEEVNGKNLHGVDFMHGIAWHMMKLHKKDVTHRDLKASNVLLEKHFKTSMRLRYGNFDGILVADFECSIGVPGTKYWRAPEILASLGNASIITNKEWKKADVYSYGMTCFEIATGRIPFDGELENTKADRELVVEGKRPQLPIDLDDAVKDLITKCWDSNPGLRPTFFEILEIIETIAIRPCQFRLFCIGDELPLQYCLATVQEVYDYPRALIKAMPNKGMIANLANGCVSIYYYGMQTRLAQRSDANYKLARFHQ